MRVESYDLFLDLDFKSLKFNGKLRAELESDEDVVLSSLGLTILGVKAENKPLRFEQRGEDLAIRTGPFRGTLEISYSGLVPDALSGIYRASYGDTYVVTTQFEASSARRMFPCVDDPGYKAAFRLSLRVDGDLDAISNMPIESVQVEGAKKVVMFKRTPRMSTYLLYLGVGRFEEIRGKLGETDIIVAAVPGKADRGRFALEVAGRSLDFLQSYFGIPFMLPKVHLVAVPEFAAGGMENWGAIAFRETALLIDDDKDVRARKRVTEVVAHELAHMWFGDMVTMRWWDDLWLNESFATLMAFKVMDELQPDWGVWQDFLRADTSGAMSRDSIAHTHPIEAHVRSPSEVEEIFDDISYGKGASVLRMIEDYMGAEGFREGIRGFLSDHEFQNAEGKDFWAALEKASKEKIRTVAEEWIRKPGYPLVTVAVDGDRLIVGQERFLLSGTTEDVWPIPIVMSLNGETKRFLLDKREEAISVGRIDSLKLNVDRVGFYRVYYEGLYDRVWQSSLSAFDRWGIVFDAFAFLAAGRFSFHGYSEIIKRYFMETSYLPALEVSDQLALLYSIAPSKIIDVAKSFHRQQLKLLGDKADENSTMLRGILANRLAMLDEDYAEELASRFQDYDAVNPDMRDAIATAYARTSGDIESILEKYRSSSSDAERVRLLAALMSFKGPSLIAKSLSFALGGEVKRQDVGTIILASLRNPDARSLTWDWLRANLGRLRKLFEGTESLSRILLAAIPVLGIGRVEEAEKFLEENRAGVENSVEAGLEKLRAYDGLADNLSDSA